MHQLSADVKSLLQLANKGKVDFGWVPSLIHGRYCYLYCRSCLEIRRTLCLWSEKRSFLTPKGEKEAKEYGKKKGVPVTVMIAVGKPKMGMPMRGGRTVTNMMKKSSRGK